MTSKLLIDLIKLLLFLIPIGLVTGPFIPDLAVSLMALIFIFISIKEKYWKYYNNNYFKFFLLFNIYLIITSLFSDDIFFSLKSSIFYFRFIFFALCVWFLFDITDLDYKIFFSRYLLVLLSLLSADAVLQYFFGQNIIGIIPFDTNRMSSFFTDRLILGSFLSRLLFLSIALFLITHLKTTNYFIILYFVPVLIAAGILVSGERTSFGLLVISCLTFFIIFRFNFKLLVFVYLTIAFISIVTVSDKNLRYRIFIEPLHQSNLISDKFLKNYDDIKKDYAHIDNEPIIFSKEHTAHYLTAFKIFKDNLILGVGPKMFRKKCSINKYNNNLIHACTTHPHNFLLQILAETGIIGLIFYLTMIAYVCVQLLKKILKFNRSNKNEYILSGCLICFILNLFPLVPTGNIFNNWLSTIFYLPFGVYLYYNNMTKNSK
jgi:O-antigen ligase